ncbi:MAG: type II secretion system F family protein [Candidatus Altiarchaeota archaeon]|nr:type II secretion system F family protein [Candidatus Altiarchaeota archaeon]
MKFGELIGSAVPKPFLTRVKKMLDYSTLKTKPTNFIFYVLISAVIVCSALAYFTADYISTHIGIIFILYLFTYIFAVYSWLGLNISAKASKVEEVLPDALQLMSSNIRAGTTVDRALIMAARPEFGPLEEEIRRVGKETMAGRSLVESISKMGDKIKSDDLKRTVELIVHSLNSGGELADLLDQSADDIREQQLIKKEISASVLMYVMFIFIAISIGAPVLFSLSSFLVKILTTNMNMIAKELPQDFSSVGQAPIRMGEAKISLEFIKTYALTSIVVTSFFGSLIMGLILAGEEKKGLKYLLPVLSIAVILYFATSWALDATIGGMMPQG